MKQLYRCLRCGIETELLPGRSISFTLGQQDGGFFNVEFNQPLCQECIKSFLAWWSKKEKGEV